MAPSSNNRTGIWLMVAAVAAFTVQDGLSRYLAGAYTVWYAIMLRYWFFAAFVLVLAWRRPEGFRRAISMRKPGLHMGRALLHVSEICVIVFSFTMIGLINTHAVFQVCPLLIALLAGPILGEKVQPKVWLATGAGFLGILLILRPGSDLFSLLAILPLISALLFALYSVLTRMAAREEGPFTAFFWSGIFGAILMTALGVWHWEPMPAFDWGLTLANGAVAILANWLIIRCYATAEANVVQPFAYLQLVFTAIMGVLVFAEPVDPMTFIGAAIIVIAGLSTLIKLPSRSS